MKQTAVEWLEQLLFDKLGKFTKGDIEEAKEMEKQQIVEAHGTQLKKSKGVTNYEYWLNGEEYYNEKFKSE